jgi:Family 4 glycosyl hydrolase C-terminal domain
MFGHESPRNAGAEGGLGPSRFRHHPQLHQPSKRERDGYGVCLCAVEVPAVVTGEGVRGLPIRPLPPGLAGILSRHAQVQQLTMQAALTGDRLLLDQAMSTDPLLEATLEPDQIRQLTADMLEANRPYLVAASTVRLYRDGQLS